MKSIWKSHNFLQIFLISTGLGLSQQIYNLATPLIVYYLTHSSVLMGLIRGIEYVPNVLLAILFGVVIDRSQPSKILHLSILGQTVSLCMLFISFKIVNHWESPVYIMIFILMACTIAFNNLRTLIIKISVGKDLLLEANSNLQTANQLIQVLGPVLTGFILILKDPRDTLGFCLAILVIVFFLSYNIKIPDRDLAVKNNVVFSIKESWHFLYGKKTFFWLVWLSALINCADTMSNIMYIFLAKETLHLSNYNVGILYATMGFGGVVGSILTPRLTRVVDSLITMKYCIFSSSCCYFILFFYHNYFFTSCVMFVQGTTFMIVSIIVWVYRQDTTPISLIGRITGLTSTIFKLGMPISAILAGLVAEKNGVKYVFLISGTINMVVFIMYIRLILSRSVSV